MSDKRKAVALLEAIATFMEEGMLDALMAARQIRSVLPMLDRAKPGETVPARTSPRRNTEPIVYTKGQLSSAGHLIIKGPANYEKREEIRGLLPEMKRQGMTDWDISEHFNLGADGRVSEVRAYKHDTEAEKARSPYFGDERYQRVLRTGKSKAVAARIKFVPPGSADLAGQGPGPDAAEGDAGEGDIVKQLSLFGKEPGA